MEKKRIKAEIVIQQEILKSKFIAYLLPVSSEEEAKERLREIRKQHPKAKHHCFAMIIGDLERSSDDGEPSSSAGLPILQMLKGRHLDYCLAVVVRYFGGTLLGVGGLIRAYGSSTRLAIEEATLLAPIMNYRYQLDFPYDRIDSVEHGLVDKAVIHKRDYDKAVQYIVSLQDPEDLDKLQELCKGDLLITELGKEESWMEE